MAQTDHVKEVMALIEQYGKSMTVEQYTLFLESLGDVIEVRLEELSAGEIEVPLV